MVINVLNALLIVEILIPSPGLTITRWSNKYK